MEAIETIGAVKKEEMIAQVKKNYIRIFPECRLGFPGVTKFCMLILFH